MEQSKTSKVKIISDTEISYERTFDAPLELFWKANSDPKLVEQWWGPNGTTTVVEKLDFTVGGEWRYVVDGEGFHGEFKEIEPMTKISYTFEYDPFPGHVSIDTGVFEEKDGKTYARFTTKFSSIEDRDAMIASGMEKGMNETHNRLNNLLTNQLTN